MEAHEQSAGGAEPAGSGQPEEESQPREPGGAQEQTQAGAGAAEPAAAAPDDAVARAEEYLQSLQRLKADFDNYRRRVATDQGRWGDAAIGSFLIDLLPVVDNLERALQAAGDAEAVHQGVQMTVRQLFEVFGKFGVRPMEAKGQPFDPNLHEAVSGVPDGGVVAQEYRRGYLFRERVLRPALVGVALGGDAGAGGTRPGAAEGAPAEPARDEGGGGGAEAPPEGAPPGTPDAPPAPKEGER